MSAIVSLPALPPWESLHPLVVHFPVALLLVAPLLLVIGVAVGPERGRGLLFSALVLMMLGTAGAWVAVATGEATGELTDRSSAINATLQRHEELAETTRATFTVLTIVFAAIVALPYVVRRSSSMPLARVVPLVFVFVYLAGTLLLVNTAHQGGRLVHELGTSPAVATAPAAEADD